jgi:hypothetical protein
VVTTTTQVAGQTDLPSTNAAVEPEKAGEHGRGFLVVAREIRRLAGQTAVATLHTESRVRPMMRDAVPAGALQTDQSGEEVRFGHLVLKNAPQNRPGCGGSPSGSGAAVRGRPGPPIRSLRGRWRPRPGQPLDTRPALPFREAPPLAGPDDGRDRPEAGHLEAEGLLPVAVLPEFDIGDGCQPLGQAGPAVHLHGQAVAPEGVDHHALAPAGKLH